MRTIKAIETYYRGYHFRSRLEARWAVFFDTLNIDWEYEPQGYKIGDKYYLPDFYLPDTKTWVEVKGNLDLVDWQMLAESIDWGGYLPDIENSNHTPRGLMFLYHIPEVRHQSPAHLIFQHHKGVLINYFRFTDASPHIDVYTEKELTYMDSTWGNVDKEGEEIKAFLKDDLVFLGSAGSISPIVKSAYVHARSARFEYGETPIHET